MRFIKNKYITFTESIGGVFALSWYVKATFFSWSINQRNQITDSPQFYSVEGAD